MIIGPDQCLRFLQSAACISPRPLYKVSTRWYPPTNDPTILTIVPIHYHPCHHFHHLSRSEFQPRPGPAKPVLVATCYPIPLTTHLDSEQCWIRAHALKTLITFLLIKMSISLWCTLDGFVPVFATPSSWRQHKNLYSLHRLVTFKYGFGETPSRIYTTQLLGLRFKVSPCLLCYATLNHDTHMYVNMIKLKKILSGWESLHWIT